MKLPPFLLDQWLERKSAPDSRIVHDLASSFGPEWTLGELVDLGGGAALDALLTTPLRYQPAAGSIALREAVAEFEGVSPEAVVVTTGAAEGLLILWILAAGPGANVVVPFPGFPPFVALPESLNVEVRRYHLRRENRFRLDLEEVRELIDARTSLVLVNTPHNPTGVVVEPETLGEIHDLCAARGVTFVVDQVYHPMYYDADRPSATRLPHATVLGDFSKALCLPGLRLGWMVERDAARAARYQDARSYFTVSSAAASEHLAVIAICHRAAMYARAKDTARRNLSAVEDFVERHRGLIDWVRPEGGFTAFPWLASGRDTRPLCEYLAREGVLVVPGDCFGMPSHVRLGYGAAGERLPEALERLSAGLIGFASVQGAVSESAPL